MRTRVMPEASLRGCPAWSRPGDAARLFARGITVRPCLPVAAVVGCVLSAINEGTQLAAGHAGWSAWVRVGLNFVVPFLVASYGYLTAGRKRRPAVRGDPAREHGQQPDPQGADRARGLPVEGYALIGDGHAAGLVGRNGSVDWLCLPRFGSGTCFAALLGTGEHGFWRIAPAGAAHRVVRRYRGETLVLETEFRTGDGVARLVDCMPRRSGHASVVRVVEGVAGRVAMRMDLVIRFDYGWVVPRMSRAGDHPHGIAGPDSVCLAAPAPARGENFRTIAEFSVGPGDRSLVAAVERALLLPGPVARCGGALADHAEGAQLRADRRDRRRGDDLAARADRRRPQLGLPLLLAARRRLHPVSRERGIGTGTAR